MLGLAGAVLLGVTLGVAPPVLGVVVLTGAGVAAWLLGCGVAAGESSGTGGRGMSGVGTLASWMLGDCVPGDGLCGVETGTGLLGVGVWLGLATGDGCGDGLLMGAVGSDGGCLIGDAGAAGEVPAGDEAGVAGTFGLTGIAGDPVAGPGDTPGHLHETEAQHLMSQK